MLRIVEVAPALDEWIRRWRADALPFEPLFPASPDLIWKYTAERVCWVQACEDAGFEYVCSAPIHSRSSAGWGTRSSRRRSSTSTSATRSNSQLRCGVTAHRPPTAKTRLQFPLAIRHFWWALQDLNL